MVGDPSWNGPGSMRQWLRAWPWRVAGLTRVPLGAGGVRAVLSNDVPTVVAATLEPRYISLCEDGK